MSTFVDLSMPVSEQTIVFPGDAKPKFEPAGSFKTTGFVDHIIQINNHLGTHIDAPGHMIEGGRSLTSYGINRFICDGLCIDARKQAKLTPTLLANIDISPGMVILFYTGCGD